MDNISMILAMLTISASVFGGVVWFYQAYSEPNFNDGIHYTNAWMEETSEQVTLHVEFIPDGEGKGTLAICEALSRLRDKAAINGDLRSKPVVVIAEVRQQSRLTPVAVVMLNKPYTNMEDVTPEQLIKRMMRNTTITYNGTCINVTNTSTGEQTCLPVKTMDPTASVDEIAVQTLPIIHFMPEGTYTSM